MARIAAAFSLVAVAVGGARAALNTHVIWPDTSAAGHVPPGTVTVSLAAPADSSDGATFNASALVPGTTVATAIDLVVNTSLRPYTITVTTMATSSSLLDQDPRTGLRLTIDRCSIPWEPVPGTARPGYRCPGRSVSVLAPRPVLTSNLPLSNLDADADADEGKHHLLFSLTLPENAGNEFQGLSSTIHYTFAVRTSPKPPAVKDVVIHHVDRPGTHLRGAGPVPRSSRWRCPRVGRTDRMGALGMLCAGETLQLATSGPCRDALGDAEGCRLEDLDFGHGVWAPGKIVHPPRVLANRISV